MFVVLYATHLVQRDDLTVRLLDLAELAEEVPEPRLGDNVVGRKNTHAVDLGGRVGLAGEVAADDLVFLEASWCRSVLRSRVHAFDHRSSQVGQAIAVEVRRRFEAVKSRQRAWVVRGTNVACVVEVGCLWSSFG